MDPEEPRKIILREDGKVTGMVEIGRRKRKTYAPPSIPDARPLTKSQLAEKIRLLIRRFHPASVKLTEEQADARALELISDAAARFEKNHRMIFKPKARRPLLSFLKKTKD